MTPKQIELDAFETIILQSLFGTEWQKNKTFLLINAFKPNAIQTYINRFETIVEPFMSENGAVNGYLLKTALQANNSMLADIVPDREFRLTDIARDVIKLIKGV
jgi:hypothetical protein